MEHRLETTVLQGLYGGHKGYIGTMEKKMETASLLRLGQTLQVVIFVHVCHPGISKRSAQQILPAVSQEGLRSDICQCFADGGAALPQALPLI